MSSKQAQPRLKAVVCPAGNERVPGLAWREVGSLQDITAALKVCHAHTADVLGLHAAWRSSSEVNLAR